MIEHTEREKLVRVATLIDCEGCINIMSCRNKNHKTVKATAKAWSLRVNVANTDPRMVEWCKENFGGDTYLIRPAGGKSSALFEWIIRNEAAAQLLAKLLDYFLIKREQAELAIQFRKTFSIYNRTPEGLAPDVAMRRANLQTQLRGMRKKYAVSEPAMVQ